MGRQRHPPILLTDPRRWVIAAAVLAVGCGVKSPPLPPIIRVADETRDLKVHQDNRRAVLEWSYPSSTTSGEVLTELESIQVWRATLNEVEAPPPADQPRDRDLNRQLLLSNGELVADLDRTALDAATHGAQLEWVDDLERWDRDHPSDQRRMIWYAVRTVCCGGRESGLSNIARLVPVQPPAPPTGLTAEPEASGIRLSWVPPEELPAIVERSPDAEAWSVITDRPLTTGEWLDRSATQGVPWNYRLRTVIEGDAGGRVVGEAGPVVGLFYADIYPPSAPADLVCLPEGATVRLRWRSVSDAGTYTVYRSPEGSPLEVLASELGSSQYEDLAPPPGTFTYGVTAVDVAGNESVPSTCSAARGAVP